MKKPIVLVLGLVVALLLCACSSENDKATVPEPPNPQVSETATMEEAPTNEAVETSTPMGNNTAKRVEELLSGFAAAYLDGDIDTIKTYMADNYEQELSGFPNDGNPVVGQFIGIEYYAEKLDTESKCDAVVPLRENADDDYYRYAVALSLVKNDSGVKIISYNLEDY